MDEASETCLRNKEEDKKKLKTELHLLASLRNGENKFNVEKDEQNSFYTNIVLPVFSNVKVVHIHNCDYLLL